MDSLDQDQMSMMNQTNTTPKQLAFQQNYQDQHCQGDGHPYGSIVPLKTEVLGNKLYSNPQCGMLIFTIILTVTMEIVMLKFVFFGIHLFIGCGLCIYILYLLLSLGFSNPGFGFEEYQRLQYHFDVQGCTDYCKHPRNLNQNFKYFCQKCKIPIQQHTKHCYICQTCVSDYDHHCVFIGKCVGGKNYGKFKLFLCSIFSTLIYGLVSAILSLKDIQKLKQ